MAEEYQLIFGPPRGQSLEERFAPTEENIRWRQEEVQAHPDDARSHVDLARIYSCQEETLDKAIQSYHKAIELEPEKASIHRELGNVLVKKKDLDEARTCYERALELNSEDRYAMHNLGVVFARQGNLNEALWRFMHTLLANAELYHSDLLRAHKNTCAVFKAKGMEKQAEWHLQTIKQLEEQAD